MYGGMGARKQPQPLHSLNFHDHRIHTHNTYTYTVNYTQLCIKAHAHTHGTHDHGLRELTRLLSGAPVLLSVSRVFSGPPSRAYPRPTQVSQTRFLGIPR